jgi:hypothetical protein
MVICSPAALISRPSYRPETLSDAPRSSASSSWSHLEPVYRQTTLSAIVPCYPSMADLDLDIYKNVVRISTIEREIAAAVYTIDALAAAHPPRLFRKRHVARLAAAEAEYAALERQYAELYTIHSAMWARRNARVSPLCRLPLELVVRILEHVAPFDLPYDHPVEWPEECVGWEPAMLVCTHLRAAALSSPALWARITNANRKAWYELCIGRSGATPLSISLVEHTSRPASIIWDLQRCPRPVHNARLFLQYVDDDVRQLLAGWMPHLRSLVCWLRAEPWQRRARISHEWIGGGSLTELVLHSVELVTADLYLPHLVRLELQDVRVEDGLSNLLRLIRAAAGLAFLCLDLSHVSKFDDRSSLGSITLPCLERIHLDGSPSHVLTLMHALPVPADTCRITTRITTHDDARHGLLAEVLSWRDGAPPVICISRDSESTSTDSVDWETGAPRLRPVLSLLTCTHPRTPNAPAVYYTGIFDSTPLLLAALHDVHSLSIDLDFESLLFDSTTEPIGPLGAVEHLALPDAWVAEVQDALRHWTCVRAAVGRPVSTVDFLGARSLMYVEDLRALRVLAKELLDEGWVHEVLHDGWTVSRETYMPADV